MQCAYPIFLKDKNLYVPCGHCSLCVRTKSAEWAIRMEHELKYHNKAIFVTLTYNDDFLPENKSLNKEEVTTTIKKIRKRLDISGKRLRYFLCGEYGERGDRPHYHLILFGMGIEDKKIIEDCWKKGFIHIGNVTEASIKYVCGYLFKSFSLEFEGTDLERPFSLKSKGLGRKYLEENMLSLEENLRPTKNGKPVIIPRYYMQKMLAEKPELKDIVIQNAKEDVCELNKLLREGRTPEELRCRKMLWSLQAEKDLNARRALKKRKL